EARTRGVVMRPANTPLHLVPGTTHRSTLRIMQPTWVYKPVTSITAGAPQGGPSSTPAPIDTAVSQAHTHANKAVLDKLSEVSGALRYGGNPITTEWATNNW